MKRFVFVVAPVLGLAMLAACGQASGTVTQAAGSEPTTTTTPTTLAPPTTTTTLAPTTTTTLPPPPSFVLNCPAESQTRGPYYGKPWEIGVGWQGQITETATIDISWGDGKKSRFSSAAAFNKNPYHGYEKPGVYPVSAFVTDYYGRSVASSCTINWFDTLPGTMNAFDCALHDGLIRAPDGSYVPDPKCGKS